MTGRLTAWTIELSQFYIEYKSRTVIKAQLRPWLLFVDGSSSADSRGAGIILISLEGFKIQQALKFEFPATNNVAEYEAMIAGLKLATDLEAEIIDIFEDSQLISKQISGEFKAHNERKTQYLVRTQELLKKFPSWRLSSVDREENQWAVFLAKLASSNLPVNLDPIYVDILMSPTIDELSINQNQNSLDWGKPFLHYILENELPGGKNEARSLMFKERN
ncbi:uncharacterized protein LOC141674458 [Apium graveolens]|uniref:uncharacterized protein LOC141674458 n=1 Tax=Apium graveolens TaxID=4045 RepID=UPI003D794993